MRKYLIITIIVISSLLTACSSSEKEFSDDDFVIFTSIYPIQYIVENIAGDAAIVESIYPPGVDAHTYEPTSKEITKMANADAFIYLGAGMESFVETAADALTSQDITFVEIGKHEELFMEADHDHNHDHGDHHEHDEHHHFDPHIWFDPLRMIEMGKIITEDLSELNPELQETFTQNFAAFEANMKEIDQKYVDTLADKHHPSIIVSHAAYGYWEERYGIEQIPVSGLTSSEEPSQKDLVAVAKLAKEQQLKYVIFEQNSSNKTAKIIQEHIHADALEIHNLEMLTASDIENKEDYLSLMEKNLEVLRKATE